MNYARSLQDFFVKNKNKLLMDYPGLSEERLIREYQDYFSNSSEENFQNFITALTKGIPLAYITGHSYFYNIELKVTGDVLIPRFETEILVELGLKEIKNQQFRKVLDMCTGSGAILAALIKESSLELEAWAVDISTKALEIAKFNINKALNEAHRQGHQVHFYLGDLYQGLAQSFELILSNPPYIKKKSDLEGVHSNVLKYEPPLALFIEDELYKDWFARFFKESYDSLVKNGVLIMEGHESHWEDLKKLASLVGFKEIEIINDLTHRPRFIKAKK